MISFSIRSRAACASGPFGAAVFNLEAMTLIAPGVNLVTALNSSVVHAEIVAIAVAQQVMRTYDLGGPGMPPCELVVSTEPCAMCFGAVHWSGVRRLICGARDEDARAIGFDEGPKPDDWVSSLEDRDITVIQDVCREEAAGVLRRYAETGGVIYNARRGKG